MNFAITHDVDAVDDLNDEQLGEIYYGRDEHSKAVLDAAMDELHARGYSHPDEVY